MRIKKGIDLGPGSYSPDGTKLRQTSPKYGFGTAKKHHELFKDNVPGPSSYDVNDRVARKTQASWGMGYGTKVDFTKNSADIPGPGSYVCDSFLFYRKKNLIFLKEKSMELGLEAT
jgi:hypothetical protein